MHVLERDGRAPAVLHVHGYCQSSEYWRPTVERLAEAGVRAIAPDLPGFGASAAEAGPYTMEAYADALADLVTSRGLDPDRARRRLDGRRRCPAPGAAAPEARVPAPARGDRSVHGRSGGRIGESRRDCFVRLVARHRQPHRRGLLLPSAAGRRHRAFSRHRAPRLPGGGGRRRALEREFANARPACVIAVPTLIIQGRHDRARTPEHGAEMRDRIPGARLEILEDAGHTPHLEQPGAFNEIALPFLLAR